METLLIVWLLCAIGCAMIASSKNRNVGAWFFIGLIFGIFGLIAAAIVEKEAPGATSKTSKASWNCPSCGFANAYWMETCVGRIDRGDGVAVVCGTTRSAIAPDKKCPQCAEMVKAEARVCRFCHYEFPLPPEEPPEIKAKRLAEERAKREAAEKARAVKQKRDNRIAMAVLAALVLAGVGILLLVTLSKNPRVGELEVPTTLVHPKSYTLAGRPPAGTQSSHSQRRPAQRTTSAPTKPAKKTHPLRQHLVTILYPSGSRPTFIIDETFAETYWNVYSVGDRVSPKQWSLANDSWVLVSQQEAGPDANIGVIVQKADTLVETPDK